MDKKNNGYLSLISYLDGKKTTNDFSTNTLPAIVPQSQSINLDRDIMLANKCICFFCDAAEINTYKILRARIQSATRKNRWNTIMITSPNAGEGKTLTSINMSLTFAKEFHHTVLLVDCDLKKQDIHKTMGVPGEKGLTDYFLYNTPLNELIIWPNVQKMWFISGGKQVLDSAEILGSPEMKYLVSEMKERYSDRYVFFDLPPLLNSADALAFAPHVDGIVLVVEAGKTTFSDIEKSLRLIPEEKFIGFVLNRR